MWAVAFDQERKHHYTSAFAQYVFEQHEKSNGLNFLLRKVWFVSLTGKFGSNVDADDIAERVVARGVTGRHFHRFAAADTGFELEERSRASRSAKNFLLSGEVSGRADRTNLVRLFCL